MGNRADWLEPWKRTGGSVRVRDLSARRAESATSAQLDWLDDNVDLSAPDLWKLSPARLLERFGQTPRRWRKGDPVWDVNDARLLRTFVWQTALRMRAGLIRPLRGSLSCLWLSCARPFLCHHGLLEGSNAGRERYLQRTLEAALEAFVLQGLLRCEELQIWEPALRFRVVGRELPRFILFTDRLALFWLCQELADRFRISALAADVEPSLVAVEQMACELTRRGARNLMLAAVSGREAQDRLHRMLEAPAFAFSSVQSTMLTDLFDPHIVTARISRPPLDLVDPARVRKAVAGWLRGAR